MTYYTANGQICSSKEGIDLLPFEDYDVLGVITGVNHIRKQLLFESLEGDIEFALSYDMLPKIMQDLGAETVEGLVSKIVRLHLDEHFETYAISIENRE